jgi:hypothetical protein
MRGELTKCRCVEEPQADSAARPELALAEVAFEPSNAGKVAQ